jgi:hypothetical protein
MEAARRDREKTENNGGRQCEGYVVQSFASGNSNAHSQPETIRGNDTIDKRPAINPLRSGYYHF